MRFFSNDKESNDDRPEVDVQERADQVNPEHAQHDFPDRVQSDPVSVPQQRAGSPWLSAPENADTSDAELSAEERRDRTVEAGRPPFHEPSAQPTAFGASTVGGAVAASATANPLNDPWQATDRGAAADAGAGDNRGAAGDSGAGDYRDAPADSGAGDFRGAGPRDGVVNDEDDRLRPDDSATRRDGDDFPRSDESTTATSAGTHRADSLDLPLDDPGHRVEDPTPPDTSLTGTGTGDAPTYRPDDTASTDFGDTATGRAGDQAALKDEGGFGDPKAVDPATGEPLESSWSASSYPAETSSEGQAPRQEEASSPVAAALKDDGGFDDPKAVDPATERPLDSSSGDSTAAAVAPVAAAGAVGAAGAAGAAGSRSDDTDAASADRERKPGSVSEPDLGSLFGTDDAQTFKNRWRDVQLRFVDSPKDATTEAAAMVDEAVDKLTASLKAQKSKLANESEDTEKLRIELRGYRDMLNRILDL